jgi:hypothetical protein
MFGYATDETEESMPLTLLLAHQLNMRLSELRKSGVLWWAWPDTKTQVTCEYYSEGGATIPIRVHTVVVSTQHSPEVTLEQLRRDVMEKVINVVIPPDYLDDKTVYHINPCGKFILGGPLVSFMSDYIVIPRIFVYEFKVVEPKGMSNNSFKFESELASNAIFRLLLLPKCFPSSLLIALVLKIAPSPLPDNILEIFPIFFFLVHNLPIFTRWYR